MQRLLIIGASGHGKVVADIAKKNGYQEIAFLDDAQENKQCSIFPVVGKTDDADKYSEAEFIVAIGNPQTRKRIQEKLKEKGLPLATLIHPSAVIGANVSIGEGTVIMAGAVVNPDAVIGTGCIINTCSSVDHDCSILDYVHIAVGSHLAGTVQVGERTWIGAGATVSNNINICSDCMIGAGAVVVKDVEEPGCYIGVPAKRVKK